MKIKYILFTVIFTCLISVNRLDAITDECFNSLDEANSVLVDFETYIDNSTKIVHDLSVSVDKSFNSIKKYKMLKESQKYFAKYYLKTNIFGMIILRLTYYVSLGISYIVCFFRKIRSKKQ